jgi:hypothetical protein
VVFLSLTRTPLTGHFALLCLPPEPPQVYQQDMVDLTPLSFHAPTH